MVATVLSAPGIVDNDLVRRHQNARHSVDNLVNELQQLSMKEDGINIDRHLNQEILNVSTKDRNAMTEEIHGVSTLAIKETPEFLEGALQELSNEIHAIPRGTLLRTAYTESQVLPDTYVNTPDFRLRFLRCELFDAKKAAIRMLSFLNHAYDLFGPQVLTRPIQISDFTEEDLEYMNLGYLQILPFRDRSGRPIFSWVGDFSSRLGPAVMSKHKLALYLHWIMSNDVESQQKGAIKVLWGAVEFRKPEAYHFTFEAAKYNKKLYDAIPLRSAAVHWCLPMTPYSWVAKAGYGILTRGNTSQVRVRFHFGTDVELLYHLKAYGIPIELIPIQEDGYIKTKQLKQWIQVRNQVEQNYDPSMILYPASQDVLFRKGGSLRDHPGNAFFQGHIELHKEEHSLASMSKKKVIIESIVQTIQERGGRFLDWNKNGWWVELDPKKIKTKVGNKIKLFKPMNLKEQKIRSGTSLFQNQDHSKTKRRKINYDSDVSDSDSTGCAACFL